MPVRDDQFRKSYDAHELLDGERLIDSWQTSGGHLTLTSQRLLHEPMRTPEDFLATALKAVGYGDAGELLKAGVKLADRRTKWAIPVGDIAAVAPGPRRFMTVTRASGEVWGVEIFAGLYSFRWSDQNVVARDRAVAAIRAAVGTGGAGPAPGADGRAAAGIADQRPAFLERLRAAGGGPAATPLPPLDDDSRWPEADRPLRRQAMITGRNVVISEDEELVTYFSPDGLAHLNFGGYGGPVPT